MLGWSLNFTTRINSDPEPLGLTALEAAAYQTVHDSFATAMEAVVPGVRSKSSVATKNDARKLLKDQARLLANIIDGQATVTDAQKIDLGLTVRQQPSPIPAPAFSPTVDFVSVNGHTVRLRIHGPDSARRGLPDGCDGIAVFSYVGPTMPTDPAAMKFEGNTTRSVFEIVFPSSVEPGATVWVSAMYFNERKQSGPGCTPVSTMIQFGGSMAA